ncbi:MULTISPECIES: YheC/YheD family endospore coat-associated protein [Bacillus]|uniref:YheC/YheD family endospore coat-associated protein n=1 Tax=Bacillus TaxID=1386 RepID=UPI0001A14FE3|nr:YheC/YheD family protein [Bacillus pseudomycoides]AIK39033.1 tubulin-tyrosine ligase family protein [Bacillus pseudomycoides]AJI15313.1 tubulin-tyrosine ligase family protein [Bacillus pseudomycoides]EEM17321.1 Glutathione synthase S6 modification [Bacillus pseudomycoides DSM 12442]MED1596161.1 YheC/YheD family protein [Bacillus pseudomycoides]MED4709959.1 YheC/YheD family protein [Bacillus pseudomycoides]
MTIIGMLHHREDPRNVRRAYACAAVAKAEGVNFFYFTPGKVKIENQTILGKIYENGEWIEKEFSFPDVIYNASAPVSDKTEKIFDYLYDRIPFTSHSIGDKLSVYNRIKKAKEFEQYLIPFYELTDASKFFDMIKRYKKVIIKPMSGHQGGGIVFIEKYGVEHYKMNEAGQISSINEKQLLDFISHKIQEQDYLVQQFISCQMKTGHVYDFRLHVQRNGEGKWVITSIFPRIGPLGSIVSNMGSGGYSTYLEIFLKTEFDDNWYNIQRYLERFAVSFVNHFDSLYDSVSFDELGIDVGIDADQKLWLFEVNWRPGAPSIFNLELDVVRNTIHYARYLANKYKQNRG